MTFNKNRLIFSIINILLYIIIVITIIIEITILKFLEYFYFNI